MGVLELKNSRISIGDGIRQNISNQQAQFNEWFFSTVQFIFAGNDSEGLQYGTIKTEEKYFLKWKEDEADNSRFKLDKYLLKMCSKERLIELMHDFVLFDGGMKKLPRVHRYFGIKAAHAHVHLREGGIIWHTQGSGKSIVMVLLAKWILENKPNARVVIVTDRDELDKQIEGVFTAASHPMTRARSGRDLMTQLGQAAPRLLCSLVHKFGRKGVDDFEQFIKDLEAQPCPTVGEIFVFVDECHRTHLDLKAYEADMRHLIDTYIEADAPRKISPFDNLPLLDLIVKTGIANAINSLPDGLKGNRNAVAETIENNVRSKIIKEHLNDPAYFDTMSAILDEIIKFRKEQAENYEEYLKKIAELAKRVEAGQADDTPEQLDTPGRRAIFNNLRQVAFSGNPSGVDDPSPLYADSTKGEMLELAIRIDETVKHTRPDGWRGVQAKENVIKAALYGILQDVAEVERIFLIIEKQKEY